MSLAWIVYALVVGALLSVAAWASERLLRSAGRQGRWAWVAAGIGSLLVPLVALTGIGPDVAALVDGLLALGEGSSGAVELPAATVVTETSTAHVEGGWSWSFVPSLSRAAELGLVGAWGLASMAFLGMYALTWRRLRRRLARWPRAEIEGSPVRLTRETGPAVVGILRPVMMVPAWIRDLPPEKRKLVLRHEREHMRAGDSCLLALFPLLVGLAPWNLPLWWQLRRLRLAVELDCDARVLADGSEAADYGRLLVSMSRGPEGWIESAGLPLTTAALVVRRSDLERRIRTMIESREKTPVLHTATLAALAGLALFVACDTPAPVGSDEGPVEDVSGNVAPEGDRDARPPAPESGANVSVSYEGDSVSYQGDSVSYEGNSVAELPPPPAGGSATDRPAFIPRDREPQITNVEEVREALAELYPEDARRLGIEGRAVLLLFVDTDGRVQRIRIQESSDHPDLDRAAMQVAAEMEFEPARQDDEPLGVWISQPVQFRAASAADSEGRDASAETRPLRLQDGSMELRGQIQVRTDADGADAERPLVIVDGVIQGRDVDLEEMNALDVESIEIVKGPAAEELYGERGADGVIHITTKDAGDDGG